MSYLVISTSLAPDSRSRTLAHAAHAALTSAGREAAWLDIAELNLPHCDGGEAFGHADVGRLKAALEAADGVILSFGIYNYGHSAIAKSVVELGGASWTGRIVGLACASGGPSSMMAPLSLANSLMLDFRCVIVPRFVMGVGDAIVAPATIDDDLRTRVVDLTSDTVRMTEALGGPVTFG